MFVFAVIELNPVVYVKFDVKLGDVKLDVMC